MLDSRFEHRVSSETGMRERLIVVDDGEPKWVPLEPFHDGYIRKWGTCSAGALVNKPSEQITEAEALTAVEDLKTNPRVKHVSISEFHPTQNRWLLNIDLVDGINGDLKGIYSIGKIYGDLRSTEAKWQEFLAEKRADEERRAAEFEVYLQDLDDAAAEAISMLEANGFTVNDVIDGINRITAGRYMDETWKMYRAFSYHSEVIVPKWEHFSDRDRPVQLRVGFYYGRRHRHADLDA